MAQSKAAKKTSSKNDVPAGTKVPPGAKIVIPMSKVSKIKVKMKS